MATIWQLTYDCANPKKLAEFWALVLGYVPSPPPPGYASEEDYLRERGIPEDEWDDGASIDDPDGVRPSLCFLKVPESKVVKNRLHVDVKVGGRQNPWEERWPRVLEARDRLIAAGATLVREDEWQGKPDHLLMADPEGNEFCLV